jgi:hypothetical protein
VGKTQELVKKKKKKNPTGGHGCLCCVRCMDDSMKHKVTCRTKRTSTVQMDHTEKPGINTKKKIPPGAWMFVVQGLVWIISDMKKDGRI